MSRGALTAVAGVVLALVLLIASQAVGDDSFTGQDRVSYPYSLKDAGCDYDGKVSYADPVGVLFKGQAAGVDNTVDRITDITNWQLGAKDPQQGLFVRHNSLGYECHGNDDGLATTVASRHHVRVWKSVRGTEQKTVGTPHWEEYIDCGNTLFGLHGNHAVQEYLGGRSGFDLGRRVLKAEFRRDGHSVKSVYWGNTSRMLQCNDKRAGSNGNVAVIDINEQYPEP